jgi:hypothetical protein
MQCWPDLLLLLPDLPHQPRQALSQAPDTTPRPPPPPGAQVLNLLTTPSFSAYAQLLKRSCLLPSSGAEQDEQLPAEGVKLLLLSTANLVVFLEKFGLRDQQELLLSAIDCFAALIATPDAFTESSRGEPGQRPARLQQAMRHRLPARHRLSVCLAVHWSRHC